MEFCRERYPVLHVPCIFTHSRMQTNSSSTWMQLQDRESYIALLVGAKYGISQIISSKLNIMSTLAEFANISRVELTEESEKVSMVKVYLQDVKVTHGEEILNPTSGIWGSIILGLFMRIWILTKSNIQHLLKRMNHPSCITKRKVMNRAHFPGKVL